MSYSPQSKKDAPLKDFATNVLSRFPGIQVSLVERKAQSAPTCPTCHKSIENCPHCGNPIARMVEKGVDTAIVTDMVKFAWEGALEAAILVYQTAILFQWFKNAYNQGIKNHQCSFPANRNEFGWRMLGKR